ncbi:ABC transporter permease [Lachnospiraceae bacterium NSJ-143]|nr:ABC transporter permease [Lachnospiraceae bacterium NSJ-143]
MTKQPSDQQLIYIQKLNRTKRAVKATRTLVLITFFLLWEVLADTGVIDSFIFSRPSSMFTCMVKMLIDGTLLRHIWVTLFETIIGFVLGTALGTAAAVVLWWNSFINKVCDPYLVVLNSLPKTALAPIIIVWLGNNMKAIIAVALLTSVIVTILNVLSGFNNADSDDIRLVESFGGSKKEVLFKVVFPTAVPDIINALKINVGLSFVGVIVGEFLTAKEGLGYLIVYGSQIFKLDWVMMSVILLALLAAAMYKVIQIFESFLLKKTGL